ncbi:MAG TPA: hypothetical protein VGF95_06485 [Solirubrobacteraceae bacterium]
MEAGADLDGHAGQLGRGVSMTSLPQDGAMQALAPLIGEWRMEAVFPSSSPAAGMEADGVAQAVFEYLPGGQFVIQRWEVPHPDAPDGIAIIGWDGGRRSLVQHYFDSRGIARLYEMSFGDGVWRLSRTAADFSPLDFAQRYTGVVSDDARMIQGAWELSTDGTQWEHDFELNYSKRRRSKKGRTRASPRPRIHLKADTDHPVAQFT